MAGRVGVRPGRSGATMKIEQIDLKLVRLPLVRPFRTSSSSKNHLDHILVRVVADGDVGWGECASPSDPYYCPETTETCWHLLHDFLAPAPRPGVGDDRGRRRVPGAGEGEQLRQGRPGDGLLGPARAARGPSPGRAARRDPAGDRLGRQPGDRARSRRALRADRPVPGRGLPPDQAQDRPGP